MTIKVDIREKDLYTLISNKTKAEYENLTLGDIVISVKNELVIIERKTLKDLAASIKDGRYREQSFRLNECGCHNHNIIYKYYIHSIRVFWCNNFYNIIPRRY